MSSLSLMNTLAVMFIAFTRHKPSRIPRDTGVLGKRSFNLRRDVDVGAARFGVEV
jgi:hypothetical protein